MRLTGSNDTPTNDNMLLGSDPNGVAGIFSENAVRNNHSIAYIHHPGSSHVNDNHSYELSLDRMRESENYMIRANKSIHRSWPTGNRASDDRIRRDSVLVRWCQSVYAVGRFTDDASLLKVAGELAWPCQMYIDRFLYDQEPLDLCSLYVFDMKSETWFNWRHRWHRSHSMPTPSGVYAVVGFDKPNRAVRTAIESLWY